MTSRYLKPSKKELGPFLPEGVGPLAGAVFEGAFDYDGELDDMERALSVMPEITWSRAKKSSTHSLVGKTKGGQMTFELFPRKGRWRLEARFRGMGKGWGSNEAYYRRFQAEALPLLGATNPEHLRPTFRRKR